MAIIKNTCNSCGAQLRLDAVFCGKCGMKVGIARHCTSCGVKLHDNEEFCYKCGMKCDASEATTQPLHDNEARKASTSGSFNSRKGGMAIIDNNLFFLNKDDQLIYTIPLDGSKEASLLFDRKNFYHDDKVFTDVWGNLKRLRPFYALNGRLYFFCYYHEDGKCKEGDRVNGLYCFEPESRRLECISHGFSRCDFTGISGKAAYFHMQDTRMFRSIDLLSGTYKDSPMPKVAGREWVEKDYFRIYGNLSNLIGKDNFSNDFWTLPKILSNYAYTSNIGNSCMSLRFSIDNPDMYDILPYGITFDGVYNSVLAEHDNLLFVNLRDYRVREDEKRHLCVLDKTTLMPATSFSWNNNIVSNQFWNQYKNILAFASGTTAIRSGDSSILFNTSKLEQSTVADDGRYGKMSDVIIVGNTIYALGQFFNQDVMLYSIPKDRLFRKDTNLNDYTQTILVSKKYT